MRLGNGLWETTQFNSRLQPTQIGLGSGSQTQDKVRLDYSYGTTQNNGNVLSQTITVPGKERDAETDLDYFGARYYLPSLGRFSSSDPITITPERLLDPQRINLYGYTRNNPLKYTDPTGKDLKLDPKQKSADADRIIKAIAEAYRREEGRGAIQRLSDSKLPVTFRSGEVPAPGKYGVTELAATKDPPKPQSVTITLDFAAIDKSDGQVTDLGVVANELYHGQTAVENDRKFMQQVTIGLGVQAGDPLATEAYKIEQLLSDKFQERIEGDKPTLSSEEAESEVRKLFGLPASPDSKPKPPPPAEKRKPDPAATPPIEERRKPN
jgi:RHS repeat-associated protein